MSQDGWLGSGYQQEQRGPKRGPSRLTECQVEPLLREVGTGEAGPP